MFIYKICQGFLDRPGEVGDSLLFLTRGWTMKKRRASLWRRVVTLGVMLLILSAFLWSPASAQRTQALEEYTPRAYCAKKAIGWAVGDPVGGYGTILHTTDGGESWERQGSPGEIPNVDLNGVVAVDARKAWVVGESDGYGVILHTRDGGKTWRREGEIDDLRGVGLVAVSAVDQLTAWAVGSNGTILHTTNGGRRWERQGLGQVPTVTLQGVYASDASHVWVVGLNEEGNLYGTIVRTIDGGATWQKVPYTIDRGGEATPLISVHGATADEVWAVGNRQILHIAVTRKGISVTDQTPHALAGPYDTNGVFALTRWNIWVVADFSNIWRSFNGGGTWNLLNAGHHDLGFVLRISAIDWWNAWATTADQYGYSGQVLHTPDGGKSWTSQQIPVQPRMWGISFVRKKHWIFSEKGWNPFWEGYHLGECHHQPCLGPDGERPRDWGRLRENFEDCLD